jgi:hypothetical protein
MVACPGGAELNPDDLVLRTLSWPSALMKSRLPPSSTIEAICARVVAADKHSIVSNIQAAAGTRLTIGLWENS